LHAAEEQYEATIAQLATLQRTEIERIGGEILVDGGDLYRHGADEETVYDEQFHQLMPDRVREAARAIAEARPHLAKRDVGPPPTERPIESLRSGARAEENTPAPSWYTAIRGS
jgi:hypothetical protein